MNYCNRTSNGFKHNMYDVMMSSAMTTIRRRNTRKPSSSGWVTLVADLSPNKAGAKVAGPRPHISTSWLPIMRKFPQSGFSNKALNQTREGLVWRSSKKTDHSVSCFYFVASAGSVKQRPQQFIVTSLAGWRNLSLAKDYCQSGIDSINIGCWTFLYQETYIC